MNLKDLDLTSCRLAGSDALSDEINLPLERALAVIELMHESEVDTDDSLSTIIEYEIRHAQKVARKCRCKVEKGGAS